jgi:hypothetical protein
MAQKTVMEAALCYHDLGLSVIPLRGKVASMRWSEYQTKIATYSHIHGWYKRGMLNGVGIVCGQVSGGLVVIDLDGTDAVNEFRAKFPKLLTTLTVRSGSGVGQHLYFYSEQPMDTTRTKGFELRSDGCYVVAPPSKHPVTGGPYVMELAVPIKHVDHLDEVVAFIRSKIPAALKQRRIVKPPPRNVGPSDKPRRYVLAYARRALENETEAVRGAPIGERNETLFHAARRLGSLIASHDVRSHGALHQIQVEQALYTAAAGLAADDGQASVIRTVKSGLERGLAEPFTLPTPRPLRNRQNA